MQWLSPHDLRRSSYSQNAFVIVSCLHPPHLHQQPLQQCALEHQVHSKEATVEDGQALVQIPSSPCPFA